MYYFRLQGKAGNKKRWQVLPWLCMCTHSSLYVLVGDLNLIEDSASFALSGFFFT